MNFTKTRAFSLMEILLATTIFAGAMIMAAGAFSGGIKSQIKAVRERKLTQEARLFEEVFARKIREATGEGTYVYQGSTGDKPITVKGLIAVRSDSNYDPRINNQRSGVLILFKPTGSEILKVVQVDEDGLLVNKLKNLELPGKNEISWTEIRDFETSNPTLFPQESYLWNQFPFRTTTTNVVGSVYENSLVTLTSQFSTNHTQCVNNNRDACLNIETKVSTREGIKL